MLSIHRRRLTAPVLSFVLALPAIAVGAQTPDDPSEESERFEEFGDRIVVTATRGERALREVPVNVSVVSRESIERSAAQTTDDVLRQLPGFKLLQEGGSRVMHPAAQSLSLRGVGGTSTSRALVLLDGVPLNDPFAGWVYWTRVAPALLERAELVRGAGTSVWGNGALGGVVHLITRSPVEDTLDARTSLGSKSTRQFSLFGGTQGERWGVSGFADWFATDGYSRIDPALRGPIDVPQDSEYTNASVRLNQQSTEALTWTVRALRYDEERTNGTPQATNDTLSRRVQANLQWAGSAQQLWRLTAFHDEHDFGQVLTRTDAARTQDFLTLDQTVPASGSGLGLQLSASTGKHRLETGVDLTLQDGDTNELANFRGGLPTGRRASGGEQQFAGLFVRDLISLSEKLALDLGLRFDDWQLGDGFLQIDDLASGATVRRVDVPDRSEQYLHPSVGLVWSAGPRTNVRGAAYTAFRAPTISELYRPFLRSGNVFVAPNAEVDPETLVGAEVGFDLGFSAPATLRATLFWNEVDDAIAELTIGSVGPSGGVVEPCGFVGSNGTCFQRANVGTVENFGLELDFSSRLARDWRFEVGYMWVDNEITAAPGRPDLVGKHARQVAEHQGSLRLVYTNPQIVAATLQARYVGDRFDDDRNTRPVDSFFVVDLRLARRLTERIGVSGVVENVFDERIEISSTGAAINVGHPRLYRIGVSYRF